MDNMAMNDNGVVGELSKRRKSSFHVR
jgi:hypothetical protein